MTDTLRHLLPVIAALLAGWVTLELILWAAARIRAAGGWRALRARIVYVIVCRLARLDPRMHIVVVQPPGGVAMPDEIISRCVVEGLRHTGHMLALEAQRIAHDRLLARLNPRIFDQEPTA